MSTITRLALAGIFIIGGRSVQADQTCNRNPVGFDQLTLIASQAGSDFDIGTKKDYQDFSVPGGGRFDVCLNNCDTTSDFDCDVEGYASGQSAAGRGFLPPIPISIGDGAVCAVTTFQEPFATGTANIATGDIDVTAQFSADVYVIDYNHATAGHKTHVCPTCSGASAGQTGVCSSDSATPGAACTTDQVVTVQRTDDSPYAVSRDCLPTGSPDSTAFSVQVETGQSSLPGLCGQTSNDCGGNACTATCTGAGNGGVRQTCCSGAGNSGKSCFADPLVRTGAAAVPQPALPGDASSPKTASETIVGTFCAPAVTGGSGLISALVNSNVGLPGPGAFVLPVQATWMLDPSPVTTTTTTPTTTTTTTTLECAGDGDCADDDPCTTDTCASGTCQHAQLTGSALVACQVGNVDPAALCSGETVDPTLASQITTFLHTAQSKLDQIQGAPKKKAKKLKAGAKKALATILKKTKKAAKKHLISDGCKGDIGSAIAALQSAVGGL